MVIGDMLAAVVINCQLRGRYILYGWIWQTYFYALVLLIVLISDIIGTAMDNRGSAVLEPSGFQGPTKGCRFYTSLCILVPQWPGATDKYYSLSTMIHMVCPNSETESVTSNMLSVIAVQ